ncbi:MAG: helix-turn-helix transcriptional regulator [Pseudomonadota bacterium]
MPLVINLDVMLAKRKVKSKDLAKYLGLSETSLSLFKSGKLKGIRFKNLEMMCEYLDCKPGDIIDYVPDEPDQS